MSLSTPQSITIDTVTTNLNRIEDDKTSSIYSSDDGTLTLRVSHQSSGKRVRRMARVDKKIIASDPLTSLSQYQTAGIYIVIDEPEFGFAADNILDIVEGLKTWLAPANIMAMLASRH